MRLALALALFAAAVPLSAGAQPRILSNTWDDDKPSTFAHVVESTPGSKTLTLHARTDASGGQTVAVYAAGPADGPGKGRLLSVIATTAGHSRAGVLSMPAASTGEPRSQLRLVVVVENASRRRHAGEYTLTVSP